MVSVAHSVASQNDLEHSLQTLAVGLSSHEEEMLHLAADYAQSVYGQDKLLSDEPLWSHALGMALILSGLKLDGDTRIAALLFAIPGYRSTVSVDERFGVAIGKLVHGFFSLQNLSPVFRPALPALGEKNTEKEIPPETTVTPSSVAQTEVLRKMLLAMVEDIRVVLLRLASRTQTLRFFSKNTNEKSAFFARETLDLYAPLANRLGVWDLKWELEDLSFRFLHPELYKKIAKELDEKRSERTEFIEAAVKRLKEELFLAGLKNVEIYGRPKHIYSIWNKMRQKNVPFSEVYDIRALRIIVERVEDCYAALSLVHHLWPLIPEAFDDYIANPKNNNYRSLHTAVRCADERSLEVQIRTYEMHKHAELGVAAHWRYKEGAKDVGESGYNNKIAWLRQLLAWKDDVADSQDWEKQYKEASFDDTIYVMTPQGRLIDLPHGATAIDFAYRVHTDLGHRCRGAKINGALVTLNTPLEMAQKVEIIAAKQGGPSRDWLNPALAYLTTSRAKTKVRQWFANLALEQSISEGKALLTRELQRMGETGISIDELASRLGFAKHDELFVALARADLGVRQLQIAVRGEEEAATAATEPPVRKHHASDKADKGILIVGVDKLLTQLAGCCKPAPPDAIVGFVTRGKGVSIHRSSCSNFAHLQATQPERVIETDWGSEGEGNSQTSEMFAVDVLVESHDRQGLLRDISDTFTREKINVIAVNTQSKQALAHMRFTAEIKNISALKQLLKKLHEVSGVIEARRA